MVGGNGEGVGVLESIAPFFFVSHYQGSGICDFFFIFFGEFEMGFEGCFFFSMGHQGVWKSSFQSNQKSGLLVY